MGARHHEQVIYVHPTTFMLMLDVWGDILGTGEIPDDLLGQIANVAGPASDISAATVAAQLRIVLEKMAAEDAPR